MADHLLEQIEEQRRRAIVVGIRERAAGGGSAARQLQGLAVGRQGCDQRTQALPAARRAGRQGEEMLAAVEAAPVIAGVMKADVAVEPVPGEMADDLLEQGGLLVHDVGFRCCGCVGERHPHSGSKPGALITSTNCTGHQWRRRTIHA